MNYLDVYRVMGNVTELVGHLNMDDDSFAYDSVYLQSQGAAALSCSLPLSTGKFSAMVASSSPTTRSSSRSPATSWGGRGSAHSRGAERVACNNIHLARKKGSNR